MVGNDLLVDLLAESLSEFLGGNLDSWPYLVMKAINTRVNSMRYKEIGYVLLLVGLVVIFIEIKLTQKESYTSGFLIAEESQNFLVADKLLHNGTLYRDIASPYGYIPAYSHLLAAKIFGNHIATYYRYFEFLDCIIAVLLYFLCRRILSPPAAFSFTLLAFIPQVIAPGSLSSGQIIHPAFPVEKVLLICVALLWSEPSRKSWPRSLLVGVCLGLLQGVKFGGGLVAGLAIALVEASILLKSRFSPEGWRNFIRSGITILLGFSIVELAWIILAYLSLPPHIAYDVLWPVYMLKNYAGFANSVRWPRWIGLGYFLGVHAVPLLGLIGSLWFIRDQLITRSHAWLSNPDSNESRRTMGIVILPLFYVIGCFIYFKQFWHFNLYSWTLVIGASYLLIQPIRVIRWATVAICVISFVLFVKVNFFKPHDPSLLSLSLDNGEQLWVQDSEYQRFKDVLNTLRTPPTSDKQSGLPVVFYPLGAGFHTFFHVPQKGRSCYFAPGLIRPYDNRELIELADQAAHWVVFLSSPSDSLSPDPAEWNGKQGFSVPTLDATTSMEIMQRLGEAQRIDSKCWIFSPRRFPVTASRTRTPPPQ